MERFSSVLSRAACLAAPLAAALLASPVAAEGYCPAVVSSNFSECVALIIVNKDGDEQVCGCRENRVEQVQSINERIPPSAQEHLPPKAIIISKTKMRGDPDPCKTIIIGGVPVYYCW